MGWPVLGHLFWQTPGALGQSSAQKTDALGGQQAHSDGSFSLSLIWIPNVGLQVSDSAMRLPRLGSWWESEHHAVHQQEVTTPERPSQVLPREASMWTLPFCWAYPCQLVSTIRLGSQGSLIVNLSSSRQSKACGFTPAIHSMGFWQFFLTEI